MENLLFLFILVHPATSAERIFDYWYKDKVLAEYERPEKDKVQTMVSVAKSEMRQMLI